ncbi:hypothetical protein [Pararhodobacter sp. SW119]|uniref:hypothetical protein n=1 Tax=Pararhodobacter sp. SW119 TaxID=2780075 RepID=UPI001ADED3E7|nr:hypothetical protein [Pararhodobacter sp. SW119]
MRWILPFTVRFPRADRHSDFGRDVWNDPARLHPDHSITWPILARCRIWRWASDNRGDAAILGYRRLLPVSGLVIALEDGEDGPSARLVTELARALGLRAPVLHYHTTPPAPRRVEGWGQDPDR